MRIISILFAYSALLVPQLVMAQYRKDIPSNYLKSEKFNWIRTATKERHLDDLTESSDSLRIRIWMGGIVEVAKKDQEVSARIIFSISDENSRSISSIHVFGRDTATRLLDSIAPCLLPGMPGGTSAGLDGQNYLFEVSTPQKYQMFNYWSPRADGDANDQKINAIISNISDILGLQKLRRVFIESLHPGNYSWGITSYHLDAFLAPEIRKSSLYTYVEKVMREKLNVTDQTSHTEFPKISLNGKLAFLKDLNKYEYSNVRSIKVYEGNLAAAIGISFDVVMK